MKYGLSIPIGGFNDINLFGEIAYQAEVAGWDGLFIEDYIVYHTGIVTFDPWIILGVMATRTERIRLGTCVTPLSRRRPWKVAREAVTLDHLSKGRLIMGFGLGDMNDLGFANMGEEVDAIKRAKMLDEGIETIVGLWSGEKYSFDGEYYQINEVTFLPKPLQKPRIPIWIGGGWTTRGPARRAKMWDGFCPYYVNDPFSPEHIREMRAFLAEGMPSGKVIEIALGGHQRREDWKEERDLIRSYSEAGATWWTEWIPPMRSESMFECAKREPLFLE